jgi:hypothetical protein
LPPFLHLLNPWWSVWHIWINVFIGYSEFAISDTTAAVFKLISRMNTSGILSPKISINAYPSKTHLERYGLKGALWLC